LACLKSNDANEWEKRLIFYLPVKAENHPQIMEHVHNERKLNSDGELTESSTNDNIHIYLNFNDEKKEFCAYYNDDEISLEKCQNELGDRGSEVHLFRRHLQ